MLTKRFIDPTRKYKVISAMLALLIFFFSIVPIGAAKGPSHLDKAIHFSAYFVFCFFLCKAFENKDKFFNIAFQTAFFYGVLMEFLQLFVHGRSFELLDMAVNGMGAGLVYVLIYFKLNIFNPNARNNLNRYF